MSSTARREKIGRETKYLIIVAVVIGAVAAYAVYQAVKRKPTPEPIGKDEDEEDDDEEEDEEEEEEKKRVYELRRLDNTPFSYFPARGYVDSGRAGTSPLVFEYDPVRRTLSFADNNNNLRYMEIDETYVTPRPATTTTSAAKREGWTITMINPTEDIVEIIWDGDESTRTSNVVPGLSRMSYKREPVALLHAATPPNTTEETRFRLVRL